MKYVVFNPNGSISAVHHRHSRSPATNGDKEILDVPNSEWPTDFEISDYKVENESLVQS